MNTNSEIYEWRRSQRTLLLERRLALTRDDRSCCRSAVIQFLERHVPELRCASIGFYWPFKGEIELRTLAESLHHTGVRLSLPVVVEKAQPVEFWRWHPGMKLVPGIWRIPVPAQRELVSPSLLIVPILGFDEAGFRLGYGGGYYDRSLAAMDPRPFTIGVGYELGRLPSIHPRPHDIPMDVITTEAGIFRDESRHRSVGAPKPILRAATPAPGQLSKQPDTRNEKHDPRLAVEQSLDDALKCTFPASDPFTFT